MRGHFAAEYTSLYIPSYRLFRVKLNLALEV